ncbi:hypothetical protein H2509_13555 [Stappia sp. F7233]|uniref:Uncharacterized protein n=1 Tax=Stappia albiluteola TaxID=2758565 RepID=A0A839AEX4_9HYPH|nr:hypothetical protein [Stappia albiluteola]MBA5778071.1 hypothetical protein [Stappia albiluteola]MBA5778151.1 hypothetical protein [Stappia albiluteola]
MMPRIAAEEQLMAINAVALGSGRIEKRETRRSIERLERMARGERQAAAKATPQMLAMIGISVKMPGMGGGESG